MQDKNSPKRRFSGTGLAEHGKVQPQAVDLEEAVLGAVMLEKNALVDVNDILYPEAFYNENHSIIYSAILRLYAKSFPIDILTVTNELKNSGELDKIGGPYFITQLTNRVASAAHIATHARIILQKFIQRELIRISTENIRMAYEDSADSFDLMDKNYTALNILANKIIRTPAKGSSALLSSYIKKLEIILKSTSDITGVPCNISGINRITGGWQNSDLIIVGGRPGMGKTAFLKCVAYGAMQTLQKPVLVFSLEMAADQIIGRFISEDTGVNSQHFNTKKFIEKTNFNKINTAIRKYFDKDGKDLLFIDDTPGLSINELRARSKRINSEREISCIIIDYLQLVNSTNQNKVYEIEEVCAGLKALGKELNIPVIAFAMLNRSTESKGGDKKPELSNLRSSGAIEQYADVVGFLHRPEYYGITDDPEIGPTFQYAEFIIAKHRNGALENVKMRFIDYLTKFMDWSENLPEKTNTDTYDPKAGLEPNNEWVPPF